MVSGVKLSHKQVKTHLESTPGVLVEPPDSKKLNFCAVLERPPADFCGFVSEEDVSETLEARVWEEVKRCLASGGWHKADNPSHKYYVVASWLQDESELLGNLSFGRVLSIVRSSAQNMQLLGHREGLLVPYELSEEHERKMNACTGKPTAVNPDEQYVQTWEELQDCLRRLLTEQKDETLEVSKVKSLFRSCFQRELSETVFGHQCLSKLLADPKMGEEFVLETMQGTRYVLRLRMVRSPVRPGAQR